MKVDKKKLFILNCLWSVLKGQAQHMGLCKRLLIIKLIFISLSCISIDKIISYKLIKTVLCFLHQKEKRYD